MHRRRRRSKVKDLDPETPSDAGGVSPGNSGAGQLSRLALTPGTLFMLDLHASLLVYIARKLRQHKHARLVIELSDSTVKAGWHGRGWADGG